MENAWWNELRRQMPVTQRWAYLDHAAVAPMPMPTREAYDNWADDVRDNGDVNWPQWAARLPEIRSLAAAMIGADSDEIALIRSTTEGINLVAEGFPWKSGDNVVTLADEFPSNLYPWLNLKSRGVETRMTATDAGRVDLQKLFAACDARTRMITLSWVGYGVGWRNDIQSVVEWAHQRDILVFLDAIQGMGVFELDVAQTQIDFLAADGHKWMLGPEGAGVFYLRKQHLDLLRPLGVGWNSVAHAMDYSHIELRLKENAARYEGGTYNMGGCQALGASLELLSHWPRRSFAQRVLEITDYSCERLKTAGATIASHRDGEHRSGIVSFELPGHDPAQIRRQAIAAGVVLSHRAGRLRISPHAYNTLEDIDRLIAAIT